MTLARPAESRIRDLLFVAVGFAAGALTAVAIAMVAAVGRQRGGEEATWLHLATLVAGMAAVIAVFSRLGKPPAFPRPLNSATAMWLVALGFGAIAVASWRGLEWYYISSGLISVAIFLLMTWLVVRVSLSLYFASNTLGLVFGSLVMDELGAFGAAERELSFVRVAGVVSVAAGVVVVRTAK